MSSNCQNYKEGLGFMLAQSVFIKLVRQVEVKQSKIQRSPIQLFFGDGGGEIINRKSSIYNPKVINRSINQQSKASSATSVPYYNGLIMAKHNTFTLNATI